MKENGRVPESFRIISDPKFQEWLLGVGLMSRCNTEPVLDNKRGLSKDQDITLRKLRAGQGSIVSAYNLVAHLPEWQQRSLPDASGFASRRSAGLIRHLRRHLTNPDSIYNARGFGYGIGVGEFRLPQNGGRLVYYLWENLEETILTKDLATALYGSSDKYDVGGVYREIHRLRHWYLPGSKATILNGPKTEGYQLTELKEAL